MSVAKTIEMRENKYKLLFHYLRMVGLEKSTNRILPIFVEVYFREKYGIRSDIKYCPFCGKKIRSPYHFSKHIIICKGGSEIDSFINEVNKYYEYFRNNVRIRKTYATCLLCNFSCPRKAINLLIKHFINNHLPPRD